MQKFYVYYKRTYKNTPEARSSVCANESHISVGVGGGEAEPASSRLSRICNLQRYIGKSNQIVKDE